MSLLKDNSGDVSSMRVVFIVLTIAFVVWVTILIISKRGEPTSEVFSNGFLGWTGEILGALIGGKTVQKHLETKNTGNGNTAQG